GVESTVAGWNLLWRRHESQSRRVKRCKAMMGKDEMSRCDVRSGTTYDEKLRGLHRTMMDRITKAQPADGTCSKYGATYLVCDEKMLGGKMMYTIYRLDRAKRSE